MTAGVSNELTNAIFERAQQIVGGSGVAVKLLPGASTLKMEFVDGQRILLNHDAAAHKIWLAAGNAGKEYHFDGRHWTAAQDGSELFASLSGLIRQAIMSNPVNAQSGKPLVIPAARAQPGALNMSQPQRPSPLRTVALLGLLGWLGYAAFPHFHRGTQPGAQDSGFIDNIAGKQCDAAFPLNGSVHLFPASHIQPDNPGDTEVDIRNDHNLPLLAIFTAPRTVIPYLSVLVQANQSASIRLPAGQYDLMFSTGHSWCNLRTGFSDGQPIKLNTTLSVLAHQPVQIGAQSAGSGADDFQIFLGSSAPEAAPPATQYRGDGVMEIHQHSDGHYHIAGAVNDTPVTYLIDTGASLTSLSQATADRAGVTDCKPASFKTASGTISGCVGRVAQLTIGNYLVNNAVVAVMPDMEVELLGMNILSQFQIIQTNGVLRLARR